MNLSLVPISQSNPTVPKVNALLEGAVKSLTAASVQGGPGALSPSDRMESARIQASEAIDFLSTEHIFPQQNATDALQFATAGVAKLATALEPAPNVRIDWNAIRDGAVQDFQTSIQALNRHSL